jgi:hypothetical protein
MKDMGMQACCLRCDEPDQKGSSRCKKCISHHMKIREEIAKASPDDPVYQFAKELLAMIVAPHRYDTDPVHGPALEEQQRLAATYVPQGDEQTEQDVFDVFETQKGMAKTNIIQNVANKNKWKDQPPGPELARRIGEDAWKEDEIDVKQYHTGRTVPSQDINPVDRSDRPGEDVEMVTKTNIDVDFNDIDSEIIDIIKNEEIHQKKKKKVEWESMISDLDDLLD